MMSSSRTPLPYASVMKPTRSACALSRSKPSMVSPAMRDAVRQDPAHRIGVQRGVADAAAGADAAEQRAGAVAWRPPARPRTPAPGRFRHACRAAGRSRPPAPPGRSCRARCAAAARRRRGPRPRPAAPPVRSGAVRRRSRTAAGRGRAGRAPCVSQVASSWRSMASVSAAAFCAGRPCCAAGRAAVPGCRDAPGSTAGR